MAVHLILPGELAKHAVSKGTKAITKFTSAYRCNRETAKTHLVILITISSEMRSWERQGGVALMAL